MPTCQLPTVLFEDCQRGATACGRGASLPNRIDIGGIGASNGWMLGWEDLKIESFSIQPFMLVVVPEGNSWEEHREAGSNRRGGNEVMVEQSQ